MAVGVVVVVHCALLVLAARVAALLHLLLLLLAWVLSPSDGRGGVVWLARFALLLSLVLQPAVALFPPPRHPCPPPPLGAQTGASPAYIAAEKGQTGALQALIEAGADVDKATIVSGRGGLVVVMCVGMCVCVHVCVWGGVCSCLLVCACVFTFVFVSVCIYV